MRPSVYQVLGLGLCVLVGCGGGGSDGTVPSGDGLTFHAASYVIGQPDLSSNALHRGAATPAANSLTNPNGVAVDANLTLVADWANNRVLGFPGAVPSMDPTASFVIGQQDFTGLSPSVDNDRMHSPRSVFLDGARIFVADTENHRVLVWAGVPQSGDGADFVLGQVDFNSNVAGSGPQGMNRPADVLVAGGRLFVADAENHRVMVWNSVPTASNVPADYALGQPNLTSNTESTTASGMRRPTSLWSDGTRLVVGDAGHARILIWNALPTTSGVPADVVVGQPDFTTAAKGGGATGFSSVGGVVSDGTRLFVSDGNLSRILVFDPIPTTNGEAAVEVIGQSDFLHTEGNDDDQDGAPDGSPTARTLDGPARMAIHAGHLYVPDIMNHRVVVHVLD